MNRYSCMSHVSHISTFDVTIIYNIHTAELDVSVSYYRVCNMAAKTNKIQLATCQT